ncbi:Cleavage stimulation factor subunit 77 [Ranunculus cassubicifolius]
MGESSRKKKLMEILVTDKHNVEVSDSLANEALHLPIAEAVPVYEQLVLSFPTAAKYWKQYVEAHMAVNNDDLTKQIFGRCLLDCPQIPLWRCYIRFIRKVNEKRGPEGQEETRKAYDFMLNYIGTDIQSGPVWMEYIAYLRSLPVMTAQEESQRMILVRKAYQKAIVMPTHHIEQLWKDYENFENSVSRALAKGLVSEYQPKYNSARAVYRERKKYADDIDWNMLAVPPTGSDKEEKQYMAWKRLIAFEKENPQRIDAVSYNRRMAFAYEQCLLYLYHYPDIWYEYATWQAKSGSIDAAVKAFQRALKAVPDSEVMWYAFAELEECRGEIQPAKKIYENLLGNGANVTALAHIQFLRFLRRTEGVEAARKYFLGTRKSPNCTYHVYVAYAMMAFCLDKDPKVAHKVFEEGMKRFMHEPGYIIEYADFLCRLNDDRNVRALFERALSSLPPEESVEVWNRFIKFEQTYGDLASMLKVEQRRKEALSRTDEEGSLSETSLHDVVSRYSFMDLWPCSSKDLDHLTRQDWLVKNVNKKADRPSLTSIGTEKGSSALATNSKMSTSSAKVVSPDTSKMAIYDPRQRPATGLLPSAAAPGPVDLSTTTSTPNIAPSGVGTTKSLPEILKLMPPVLVDFITHLPVVDGPSPNVDMVLSILLQSSVPAGQVAPPLQQLPGAPAGSQKSQPNPNQPGFKSQGHSGKRKNQDRHDDDETTAIQSKPVPRDAFMFRQIRKARGVTGSSSQTGSASGGGSMLSGEHSGSTS